mgnify:CR=1 FL=1
MIDTCSQEATFNDIKLNKTRCSYSSQPIAYAEKLRQSRRLRTTDIVIPYVARGYEQRNYLAVHNMQTADCKLLTDLRFTGLALAACLEEFGYFLFFHESPFREFIHHEVLDILIVGAALVCKTLEAFVDKRHE